MNAPRRWRVGSGRDDLIGTGLRVLVKGLEVRGVRAYDVDQGWVEKICRTCREDGQVHPSEDGARVCTEWVAGSVQLIAPEGSP